MEGRTIRTETAAITLDENGILVVRPYPGRDQGESDTQENLNACRELVRDEKAAVLVDLRQVSAMDKQARRIYATEAEFALAQAMVVDSAFTRIMANVFIRVAQPVHPTRMFTSVDEATEWLAGFRA